MNSELNEQHPLQIIYSTVNIWPHIIQLGLDFSMNSVYAIQCQVTRRIRRESIIKGSKNKINASYFLRRFNNSLDILHEPR